MKPKVETLIQQLVPTLYEDDFLLAVAKPAGVDTGGRSDQATTGLIEILSAVRGHAEKLQPVNRLSRYESGVLLLGKESATVEHIRKALKSGSVRQEYMVVVLGRLPRPGLEIDPARRGPARIASGKADGRRPKHRRSKAIASGGGQTSVVPLRQGKGRTYVCCRTGAENTHALRAQLRGAGLRVLGDNLHDESRRSKSAELTCLHIARMSFYHPGRKQRITVGSKPPASLAETVDGERDIRRPLQAGLVRRLSCLVEPDTDSYRLLTGDVEDIRGLVAEKYGRVVILQIRGTHPPLIESLLDIARWYKDTLGAYAVYAKHFAKDRASIDDNSESIRMTPEPRASARAGARTASYSDRFLADRLRSPKPLVGKPAPDEIEILERGLKFAVRPHEGSSVGLFLDQRDNRMRVRDMAEGKDVLNLFAYTCGFSVAAAAGGASSTVSVDLSPGHLEWGKANFARNGLDLANHRFVRSDAAEYFKRAKRQGQQFDLIIIDAPTFARARRGKQTFSIARDLPVFVAGASELLRPGGHMMISTNNRRLSLRRFKELIREGATARHFRITSTPPLPIDFAVDRDHAKTIFVRFK